MNEAKKSWENVLEHFGGAGSHSPSELQVTRVAPSVGVYPSSQEMVTVTPSVVCRWPNCPGDLVNVPWLGSYSGHRARSADGTKWHRHDNTLYGACNYNNTYA